MPAIYRCVQRLLGSFLLLSASEQIATAAVALGPEFFRAEDLDSPFLVVGKLENIRPLNSPAVDPISHEYEISPLIQFRGVGESITRVRQKLSPGSPLELGVAYLFPVTLGSAGYEMRDWLVPLPISKRTLNEKMGKLKVLNLAVVHEILKQQLAEEDPMIVAPSLLQLSSLELDAPLEDIKRHYTSGSGLLAASALHAGLRSGDPDAFTIVCSKESPIFLQGVLGWLVGDLRRAIERFPPNKITPETLLSSFASPSPDIQEAIIALSENYPPDIKIAIGSAAMSASDINIAYAGMRMANRVFDMKELKVSFPKFKENPAFYIQFFRKLVQEQGIGE